MIENAIKIAGLAPSGANKQPWTYVEIVNKTIKKQLGCEKEIVIAIFKQNYGKKIIEGKTKKVKHYYVQDSCAISAGFLIGALSLCGIEYKLLLHEHLNQLLKRPENEKPLLLMSIKTKNGVEDKLTELYEQLKTRRSVRHFKNKKLDVNIINNILHQVNEVMQTISHKQAYHFEIVPINLKSNIRNKCEAIEQRLYQKLISDQWRNDLAPLKTNAKKEHLTEASDLIVVFQKNNQSRTEAGIAIGLLIEFLHLNGLSTLTYTPSPMTFLKSMFNREEDSPMMILPVGYKADDYQAPKIKRKRLNEILMRK